MRETKKNGTNVSLMYTRNNNKKWIINEQSID